MSDTNIKIEMSNHFSEKWWSKYPEVLEDLMKMLDDRDANLETPAYVLNRPYLVCKYILKNFRPGATVLDMACGIGFVSHCLLNHGYKVDGFDFASKGIQRAKQKAQELGHDPALFTLADEEFLHGVTDEKYDAVLALGYLRYVDPEVQNDIYENVRRILKPNGIFVIDHQNDLYEIFSLNSDATKFWGMVFEEHSGASKLFGGRDMVKVLEDFLSVPERKYSEDSISKKMPTFSENPLCYRVKAESLGFRMLDLVYPHPDLIPPFLQNAVDNESYRSLCREVCLDKIRDWRSMFMSYQFLTFLRKQ